MFTAVTAFLLALERLIPLLSKAIDFAVQLRADAQKRTEENRKQAAEAKFKADLEKIDDVMKQL